MKIGSWGRLGSWEHEILRFSDRRQVLGQIGAYFPGIAHGMGRSYGDVCLNSGGWLWQTRGLDRFIEFDQATGRLVCEAGALLRDIQQLVIPRGWILPVTPGTQWITVGGAIANDVHGKNHHVHGSFGDHIRRLTLVRTDGSSIECGPDLHADWFAATVGGIGLTGVIVDVEIQLRRIDGPWLDTEILPYACLDEFFDLADRSETEWEHTVSWIDCLAGVRGRGIFMRGNPSSRIFPRQTRKRALSMPLVPPFSLVNRLSLRPFNSAYFNLHKWRAGRATVDYESFFYPLDNLHHWNRMYGPKGFFQYQCVLPREAGQAGIGALLTEISRSGQGSFLAVLKTFGNRHAVGMMSFPRPGVTLALDFPNQGNQTEKLFERLDAVVAEAGGRIYMAKDARMPQSLFIQGYPRLNEFIRYRDSGIDSALARRLIGS